MLNKKDIKNGDIIVTSQYPHSGKRCEVIGIANGTPVIIWCVEEGEILRNGRTIFGVILSNAERISKAKLTPKEKALELVRSKDPRKKALGLKLLKAIK